MHDDRSKLALGAALGLLLAGTAAVSNAQNAAATAAAPSSAPSGGLEEVTVTAERRTEKLMDVPMSIQAFSPEALEKQGIHAIDDLSRVAPGVTFIRQGMGASGNYNDEDSDISIRGVDSSAGASTTGIYIDDTPIQSRKLNFGTLNPFPALFDLDRIEVLKGPQGTLFGSGSEGGTLRFITPAPSLSGYSGFAKAEFGQVDGGGQNYEAGLAVGGAIIDGVLGFRISGSFRQDGGWVDRVDYTRPPVVSTVIPGFGSYYGDGLPAVTNTTETNANWIHTDTFRIALRWEPRDDLTIDPSYYTQEVHVNDTAAYWLNISDPANNVYNNGNALKNPSTDPWYVAALRINWNQPWATVTNNTSYYSRAQHSTSDYTQWISTVFLYNQYPPVGDASYALFTDRQDNFTEELRFASADPNSRLQWTGGLFYLHALENSTEYIVSPDIAPSPIPGNLGYLQPRFSNLDEQIAAFGEVNYKFTEWFKLTAGVRVSDVKYSGHIIEIQQGAFGNLHIDETNSGENHPVTPRAVLNFTPTPDQLYYLSAAKGFRPGGINAQLPAACTSNLPFYPRTYAPDQLWQYELGFKDTLLDHKLTVSASVYYIDWSNIQQFTYLICGLGFDYNLGKLTGKGADIEVNYRPIEDLSLGLTAGYTDSRFNDTLFLFPGAAGQLITAGNHLPASPWNTDWHAEYTFSSVNVKPYLRADFQFATAQNSLVPYQDVRNAVQYPDPTLPGLPEIRVLSFRGGVHLGDTDLSAFVQNATNFHTPVFVSRDLATSPNNYGAGFPNFDTNYFGRPLTAPRTFGLTAIYRF